MTDSTGLLVDTNILVYAFDPRDSLKQRRAIDLLSTLIDRGRPSLSVQCLSEFYNTVTLKLPERLTTEVALKEIQRYMRVVRVFDLTPAVVLEACRGASAHKLSVWDALIWAVAKLNQVPYVLTEDFQHGRFLEGVRFQNPFVPEFNEALVAQG
jgi:predicted nucleic acid-binding protein